MGACALLAAVAAAPLVVIIIARQATQDATGLGSMTGVAVTTALVTAAALANLARVVLALSELWPVAVVLAALAANRVIATAVSELAALDAVPPTTWLMVTDLGVVCSVLVVAWLLPRRSLAPPPLALGAVLGVCFGSLLVTPPVVLGEPTATVQALLAGALVVGYAMLALLVARHWPWSTGSRHTVSLALVVLGSAHALHGYAGDAAWAGLLGAVADLLAAVLIATTLYAVVNGGFFADRRRFTALREQLLEGEEATRRARADQHAVRNMVAGITMASELLEDAELEEPTRLRLQHTIHVEAVHLRLLLDESGTPPAVRDNQHDDSPAVRRQLAQ